MQSGFFDSLWLTDLVWQPNWVLPRDTFQGHSSLPRELLVFRLIEITLYGVALSISYILPVWVQKQPIPLPSSCDGLLFQRVLYLFSSAPDEFGDSHILLCFRGKPI